MSETLPPYATRGLGGEAARIINPQTGEGIATGANVTTYTQAYRDRLAAVSVPPLPHGTEAVTVTAMQPIVIALLRGAILALVLAAINFFTCWQLGFTIQQSLISAALLFFTTIQGRGVIEGAFDQWRAEKV